MTEEMFSCPNVLKRLMGIAQLSVSGNKVNVCYHLCICHTFDNVFELHQNLESMHQVFHIIKNKNTFRLSFAA